MKHLKKRILSLLLALALLLTLLPTAALAEDGTDRLTDAEIWAGIEPPLLEPELIPVSEDYAPDGIVMEYDPPAMSDGDTLNYEITQMLSLSASVKEALLTGVASIDLSSTGMVSGENEQFRHIVYYCPYADGTNIDLNLTYYTSSNKYAYLNITNNLSAEDTAAWIEKIDAKLAEIFELLADESLSAADQALILHDYMAAHYHYAQPIRDPNDYYPGVMLTENQGVCQAYAYLFQYIMNSKGIECYTTTSSGMHHAWNILGYNGNYYQIDVTWDDPTNDYYGLAYHNYFMLSDATMSNSAHGHWGWDLTGYACNDTGYENAYFTSSHTPVAFYGADRYYINGYGLACYHTETGTSELKFEMDGTPYGDGTYFYAQIFSGLWYNHGKIFYNSPYQILAYEPVSGEIEVVATPDTSSGYIYGSVYGDHDGDGDDEISYELATDKQVAYADKNLQELAYTPTHIYDSGVVTTTARCEKEGVMTYTCLYCDAAYTETISALGHIPGEPLTLIEKHPGCTTTGLQVTLITCRRSGCGALLSDVESEIPALGHTPGEAVTETVKEATCTEAGRQDTVVYCTVCNAEVSRTVTEIPTLNHTVVVDEAVAATCTTAGKTAGSHCAVCGEVLVEQTTVAATGHSYVDVVTPATCIEAGYTTHTCSVCGDTYTDTPTAALGHSYVDVVTPATCIEAGYTTHTCSVCGDSYVDAYTDATGSPFEDVQKESRYYYYPVLWAVDAGITNGTSATKFSPDAECTREQVVTFLWRAAGSPEPTITGEDTGFTDLPKSTSGYYKAILWGYETGIVKGTGATKFGFKQTVTRAQFVTFLWRYAGSPEPTITGADTPFEDLPKATSAYYKAILWAYENGVTTGDGPTIFKPNKVCTRGQVVTFLYRYCYEGKGKTE